MRIHSAIKAAMKAGLCGAVFALFAAFSAGTASPEEALVKGIEFKGLRRVNEAALREKISHTEGPPLSFPAVSKDIKAVYKMGYFEDVRVEVEPFEGGLKLIYIVKEKPTVSGVDFSGNEEVPDDKIRETLTIRPGSAMDIVLIQENTDKLLQLYEKEGYPHAEIFPVLRRLAEDRVLVTYRIKEGSRVKLDRIAITGNKAVDTEEIEDAMETVEWWLLSPLTGSGRFERSKINSDVERIKELYLDRGYLKAEVSAPVTKLKRKKKWMDISIEVKEAGQYTLSSVELGGNTAFEEWQLRRLIGASPGSPASRKTIRADVASISDAYTKKGFAMVNV